MKAGVIFTGSGPILILTTHKSFSDQGFSIKMARKGIKKYISYEVDVELCRKRYGKHFQEIAQDLRPEDDLRVLDYNGHNVFYLFSFDELGVPLFKEPAD